MSKSITLFLGTTAPTLSEAHEKLSEVYVAVTAEQLNDELKCFVSQGSKRVAATIKVTLEIQEEKKPD